MQTTKKHAASRCARTGRGGRIDDAAVKHRVGFKNLAALMRISLPCVVFGMMLTACTPAGPKAVLEGKLLLERGDFPQAVEALRVATRLMPTNAIAFNYLGLALHQTGQAAEAERAYLHALSLDQDLAEVHYDLGCLWLAQSNKLEQAKSQLTAYTMSVPANPDGWLKLGQAQFRNREFSAADRSLEEALRLNPHDPDTLTSLGLVRYQRKRSADANQLFARALKEQPSYGPALLNSAIVAQEQNDVRLALQRYKAYASLKPPPENLAAVLSLIQQLELQLTPPQREIPTNRTAAVAPPSTNLSRAVPLDTVRTGAVLKPAPLTNATHAPQPARLEPPTNGIKNGSQTTAARSTPPANPALNENLPVERLAAEPVIKSAEDELSITNAVAVQTTSGKEPSRTLDSPNQAKPPTRRSLLQRLNPINLFTREEASAGASNHNLHPSVAPSSNSAGTNASESITRSPEPRKFPKYNYLSPERPAAGDRTSAEVVFAQGVQLQQARRLGDAMEAYRRATQLDPSFYNAQYNLGLAASESGNSNLAFSAYETALAIDPASSDARYNFALILKKAGFVLDAVSQFEKILAAYPNDPRAHLALGNVYAQQLQDPSKARQHYQAVLAAAPQSPQAGAIRYWLSDHPR